MPRKASQAAKKDTAAEPKSEGGSTRRSGRAAAAAVKQESKESSKEATRSRRSSTAAQTAASVADSKTPKRSSSSRRDSTSPSDGRQKTRRESVESPATRVKSTRRATSRVNYKESDGEDETVAPKYDEKFESNEELDDSESDEKNKPKGRTRGAKSPAKGRGAKDKPKGGRGRRGRPSKKQSSDEDEPIELSEESVEIESETIGKKPEESPKESTRSGRGRKSKADTETKSEDKPKSSRRSARASTVKEEPPKKRPSRGLQVKKYTEEEDDDDIEEIDSKTDEDVKPQDSGRKRKRGSTTETNKRLKEEENAEDAEKEGDGNDETSDKNNESKPVADSEKDKKDEPVDEPMEVEASDETDAVDDNKTDPPAKEEEAEEKESVDEEKDESKKIEESEDVAFNTKEKLKFSTKQGSVDSSENLDESMHSFDSDQGSRAEQSISSGLEDSQDTKETKIIENTVSQEDPAASEKVKSQVDYQPDSSDSFQELDDSSESKSLNETSIHNEQKQECIVDKKESNPDLKTDSSGESFQNASSILPDNKTIEFDKTAVTPSASSVLATSHSKESNIEMSLNGSEKVSNSAHVIHSTSGVNLHPEDSVPKANGAHDLHNSVSENDQYYPFPGRKYVINAKLGDSIRQSVKDKSFGFVSYNLGISSSDSSIQKEKLLNELNKLDAHIICIQQISKPFYFGILEPSLDALGFKGTFVQPEESEKGMATFYKSSLFRLSGQSEASLKHLVEKELEASSLDSSDRMAVKSYVKKCGHVLFTHFATVIGMHSLTVANVQVPPTDLSIHALQVSCLVREVVKINGGTSRPFLLGGEFNMMESEAPYQLLRDGYLSNDMIEELQRRKDVVLPGKENAALVNLLWKSFQHPSSTLCSCYKSVLDHEVFIPEQKITSKDLLWYSSDSLYTVGVLDASETLNDHRFSLKADIAFSV